MGVIPFSALRGEKVAAKPPDEGQR